MAILKGRCRVAPAGAWNVDAFIHLSFLTGCSPDEIRGLYWDQVDDLDSEAPGFDVTRTLRHNGGTKTLGAVAGWACRSVVVQSSCGGAGAGRGSDRGGDHAGRYDTTEATRGASRHLDRPFTILGLTS